MTPCGLFDSTGNYSTFKSPIIDKSVTGEFAKIENSLLLDTSTTSSQTHYYEELQIAPRNLVGEEKESWIDNFDWLKVLDLATYSSVNLTNYRNIILWEMIEIIKDQIYVNFKRHTAIVTHLKFEASAESLIIAKAYDLQRLRLFATIQ